MNILITGASGFIGKSLVRQLIKEEHRVIAFDIKKSNIGTEFVQGDIVTFDFDKILNDVDIVFHLAGLLGTTELFHRIKEAEKINVLGTLNLLESMRKNDVNKIVFTSKPNMWKYNVYTITKENCERYLHMYREIYGFKTTITRPFNVYGPEEYLTEYRKAIPYFIIAALKGKTLEIFGDGKQTMDAIYVDDTTEALILCAEKLPLETVEIGTGIPVGVNELAKKILELTGTNSEIRHLPMRRGEMDSGDIRADGKMEQLIGFKPKITLEEGLKKTIEWYKEHLDEFREIYKFKKDDFQ